MEKIYTIYDIKADAYLPTFCMKTKGQAIRAFSDSVNDPKTQFNAHPEDYTLLEIGQWDERTCKLEAYEARETIGNAADFKEIQQ